MAAFYGIPSLQDLLTPIEMYGPPPEDQMFGDTIEPVQPRRIDLFADRLIGDDRYQDLSDQARRRALGAGMMQLGEHLSSASLGRDWTEIAKALHGMAGSTREAFERGLAREQGLLEHEEERDFRNKERENLLERQQHEEDTRNKELEYTKELNSAASESIKTTGALIEEAIGQIQDPQEAANFRADWNAKKRMYESAIKAGVRVTPEQAASMTSTLERIYERSGPAIRGKIDQKVGEDIYAASKKYGVTVEEVIERNKSQWKNGLSDDAIEHANKLRQAEIDKLRLLDAQRREGVVESLTPEEKKEFYTPGTLYRAPAAGAKPDYKSLLALRGEVGRIISNPNEAISPELAATLQGHGIEAKAGEPLNTEFGDFIDLWKAAHTGGAQAPGNSVSTPSAPVARRAYTAEEEKLIQQGIEEVLNKRKIRPSRQSVIDGLVARGLLAP